MISNPSLSCSRLTVLSTMDSLYPSSDEEAQVDSLECHACRMVLLLSFDSVRRRSCRSTSIRDAFVVRGVLSGLRPIRRI